MRQSLRRPSAAMVVACLALLVALGGTSYATVLNVPRNSVGPLQLKRNAVGPSKVAPNAIRAGHVLNGSLLTDDFKPGQIPQGPKGDKGDKGDKGAKGDQGAPGVSQYQLVSKSSPSDSSNVKSVGINCPTGTRSVGGGGLAVSPGVLTSSIPNGATADGWIVQARELTPSSSNWYVNVVAICAKVST